MKKQVRRIVLGVIGGCGIVYGIWRGAGQVSRSSRVSESSPVSLICDHIYSDTIVHTVSRLSSSYALTDPDALQVLHNDLTASFPVVLRIWSEVSSETPRMHIVGTRPRYVINHDTVVGENRRCFSRELFATYNLSSLNHFVLDHRYSGSYIDERVDQFLQNIPDVLRNHYTITYHKPTLISLHDTHRNVTVIADEHSVHDGEKLARLHDITRHYTQRKKKMWAKRNVVYDVRFTNRIIVRPRLKGECVA